MSSIRLASAAILAATVGCTVFGCSEPAGSMPYRGEPAELCNVPGRQALAEQITARGGLLVPQENAWDNSVDAATKEKMGPPLASVVLPQDRFSAQDVAEAQVRFPEAQVSSPLTLDEYREAGQTEDDD